jgi:osmoprotectant transport system permease protein
MIPMLFPAATPGPLEGIEYIRANPDLVLGYLGAHLQITGLALLMALLIALPLGTLLASHPILTGPVMGFLGLLYTIPSLALIVLLLPFTGLNAKSVTIALIIYAQVILVRNIVAGLTGIDRAITEAARGMGMNAWQRWWRVQLPLALPVILAGVRIAAVVCVGIATIGAKFNAGGLGVLLFQGIAQGGRADKIWAGALLVGGLSLVVNTVLLLLERALSPATRVQRAARRALTRHGAPSGAESETVAEGVGVRG